MKREKMDNLLHASFDEMKSIFVNKPTQEGLRVLKVALVEFTGQTCFCALKCGTGILLKIFGMQETKLID